ncbi:MAG: S9 family peptidase [Acidobacteria bacterium]|nr:S9 family peptidase [Acidobacteriota bacterium]
MSILRSICISAVAALLFASATAQTAWSPELQVKTKAIGAPRVSPNGKHAIYTVNEAVMTADKSEFVTQLWMATTDGKENYQVTFGDKSSTNPKWSPDGNSIAFTSNRKDNKNNLYVLRLMGGEAEPVTDVKSAVSDFEWSPDGRWLAYMMTDPKAEDEEKNDKGRNDYRWVDDNIKMSRLYVVSVAKDAGGKREPRKLTADNRNITGFNWSPDGTRIVFNHVSTPSANDWTTSDISVVEVASAKVTPLASTPSAESALQYSPDGKWISGIASDVPARWAQSYTIRVYPAGGGEPRVFGNSHDSQPSVVGWSADGSRIYFFEAKGTGTALYYVDVASGKIVEDNYAAGVVTGVNFNNDASMIGMVMQNSMRPPEAFVVKIADRSPTQISHANDDVAKMPFGKTEVITWKSSDGRDIEGLLTYPVGYVAGSKVRLILNVHGGPAGVFQQNFIGGRGSYPIATFASRGYAVLRPNPRGSSGYGTEFRRANIKDWGGMDYQDLMSGVDKVISMGVADPERLGVMGWSYGGYMTSTIITKTKRFKAASAGAPVTNLMSFNGTADIPAFVPDYFGGQSWENPEVYAKHSAMFNIKNATTPTLIQHGEADVRVPISQGYELYNALKAQGVPTRMIILPRMPHGPNEPKMQVAAMQSNLDWFEKYLK